MPKQKEETMVGVKNSKPTIQEEKRMIVAKAGKSIMELEQNHDKGKDVMDHKILEMALPKENSNMIPESGCSEPVADMMGKSIPINGIEIALLIANSYSSLSS